MRSGMRYIPNEARTLESTSWAMCSCMRRHSPRRSRSRHFSAMARLIPGETHRQLDQPVLRHFKHPLRLASTVHVISRLKIEPPVFGDFGLAAIAHLLYSAQHVLVLLAEVNGDEDRAVIRPVSRLCRN